MFGICEDVLYVILKYVSDSDILNLNKAFPELIELKFMKKRVDRALAQCYGPFWRLDENLINKIIGYVDDQSLQILSLTVGDLENLSKKLKCRIDSFAKKNKHKCMQCYHRYEKEWQIQYHRSCRKCKYLSL